MLAEDRRKILLEKVAQRGSLSVADAEAHLNVSRMTIHRDLDVLADEGLLRKVHGGAVALTQDAASVSPEKWLARPFEERQPIAARAKQAIARHVAKMIGSAHTLLIDASSTSFGLGEALAKSNQPAERYVVTGGLPLFGALLQSGGDIRVALHGGEPHARTGSLVGPLAEASLREMRFDWAIVSAAGLMVEEGIVYEATQEEAILKRTYLCQARKSILAMDSSKVNSSGPYKLADFKAFDALVTEKGAFALKNGKRVRIKI